jgi:hypothetical protein
MIIVVLRRDGFVIDQRCTSTLLVCGSNSPEPEQHAGIDETMRGAVAARRD